MYDDEEISHQMMDKNSAMIINNNNKDHFHTVNDNDNDNDLDHSPLIINFVNVDNQIQTSKTPPNYELTTPDSFLSPNIISSDTSEYLRFQPSHLLLKENVLYRVKNVLVAGTGFLCDAYDLFVINLVLVILSSLYKENSSSSSIVSTGALWGAVVGQLVFGFVADRVGRRIGFIITLTFIIVGAFGSCLSFNVNPNFNIFAMLALWRCILGFGIGGEYPLSATISSETSQNDTKRGSQVAAVFSMQGVGIILSPLVVLVLLKICGPNHTDLVWRLALAFGGIPGLIMIYFRLKMKETTSFSSRAKLAKRKMFKLIVTKYWKTLLGTAGGWFIFDITFYANGLFNATIVSLLGFGNPVSDYDKIYNTTIMAIYLALLGLPGYFVGVILIDRVGRKRLQMVGFILLGITYLIMGLAFDRIVKIQWLFIILYGLTFFFSNAGPNTTTFVLPSESFPTKVRATCHGISAAAGKIGAVIGGAAISPFYHSFGLGKTLLVCAGLAFSGFILTLLVVKETMGKPIQEDDDDDIDMDTIDNETLEEFK
ncbi:hypothetical protein CYY_002629 [Polysphondylium violaceum]|uniref:Major facilitator superfamily (MFS) profile domain-containing protein n=1 Tax=Polysphondylium violaceum TaxID=133409 RepID=A0A8J4V0P9_9MYCE|nr:hypothetical protein CYY_002629 [Polysphondylium violaceum]